MIQADMFENDASNYLWSELQKTQNSLDRVRRGVFVKVNELENLILEVQSQLKKKNVEG